MLPAKSHQSQARNGLGFDGAAKISIIRVFPTDSVAPHIARNVRVLVRFLCQNLARDDLYFGRFDTAKAIGRWTRLLYPFQPELVDRANRWWYCICWRFWPPAELAVSLMRTMKE
ncbi:hypothetical protein [Pandoraea horticolens]|uniref:hypothetical protein n=1 Tax=Pandoraea horticolens TaxID=2508298 RepID=UPI00124250BC|nr:hypothetical protein [Pandoraea horticolens]